MIGIGEIMGKTKLRRLIKQENKWIEHGCERHKHDFSNRAIVHLSDEDKSKHTGDWYYLVDMCAYCHSFIKIELIKDLGEYKELKIYQFSKPHGIIGFKDIKYIKD